MFKSLMTKKLNKKGFTLAELLVVVAILAILIAVSVPIFASRIEGARKSTDLANIRAAKAAAVTDYLSAETTGTVDGFYDADKGIIVDDSRDIKPYGQSKASITDDGTTSHNAPEGKVLEVKVDVNGNVTMEWVAPAAGAPAAGATR